MQVLVIRNLADKLRQQTTELGNFVKAGRCNNSAGCGTLKRPTRLVQVVIVHDIQRVLHVSTPKLSGTTSRNSTLLHVSICQVSGLGDSLRTTTAIASTTDVSKLYAASYIFKSGARLGRLASKYDSDRVDVVFGVKRYRRLYSPFEA
jgi:hypothetical protein